MVKFKEYSDREMLFLLSKVDTLGAISIKKIFDNIVPLNKLFYIKNTDLLSIGISKTQCDILKEAIENIEVIMSEYESLYERNISFVIPEDSEYPNKLKNIYAYPMGLYIRGKLIDHSRPAVAIVGGRTCSSYGKEMAIYISNTLAKNGINIISGMASGIDRYSHCGCMNSESSDTIAVLGNGVNICYPNENIDVYEKLISGEKGCVISELPCNKMPNKRYFPMRNRIISGMADVIIVIEAKEKSGSLITAAHALEQGKDIFVLPGRCTDYLSKGSNLLIADGANILNSPNDILEYLGLSSYKNDNIIEKNMNTLAKNEKRVYSCLDLTPKYLDNIVRESGLEYIKTISILLELELKGLIEQVSSNYYSIKLKLD